MIVALDYDGTYTADPELFALLIALLKDRGHQVIIATMRYADREEIEHDTGCTIYYTGRKAKAVALRDLGMTPDIWIDDMPLWIHQDSI